MTPTVQDYEARFQAECANDYPEVDRLEQDMGMVLAKPFLLEAARVLACPVKANPPSWQHGRVIFSVVARYLADGLGPALLVDIGTAKGFSALCLLWAARCARREAQVLSIDVVDPRAPVLRNTVAEARAGRALTLAETLRPWPVSRDIQFMQGTGEGLLSALDRPVTAAFVDGKHTHAVVASELDLLSRLQRPGMVTIADDLQIEGVAEAVREAVGSGRYTSREVTAGPRRYAVLTRTSVTTR